MQLKTKGRMLPIPRKQKEVEYLIYPKLEKTGAVDHLFTTRLGGVSKDHLATMNLSFARGDREEYVRENYRRIAAVLHCEIDDFVFSHQTHTANVRAVTGKDRGKGLTRPLDYQDVDGLVTAEPGLVLSTFFADCVPLFLVEPKAGVIGLSHSGWRGTAGRIGEKTVELMEELGAERKNILAAIGPSICQSCYEVSEDVAEAFRESFPGRGGELLIPREEGKFLLDLWQANRLVLTEAGILPDHIEVTGLCTCCNPQYLFSHRASKGMRGNMGAFLKLKKS